MSLARNLIEEARRFAPPSAAPSGPPSFECRWSLAVAYYFLQTTRFRPGLDLSRDAERPCAGEAGFWLARGALHELLSGFGGAVPQVAPETVAERLEAEPGEGRQGALARFCLRRALEIAEQRSRDSPLLALPDLDAIRAEAHLRLGRILAVAGRADEGARELSWVLDHDLQAERLYLAHLFLGVIHEGRGQTAEAALRYRTAAALMPAAQSARLALSFLKILEGSPAAARDELLRTIHSEPQSSPDAWLLYNVGTPIWGLDRVMRDLYGALGIPTPR
jgi:tetratricopeptide (TPR) repeat protein